MIKIELNDGRVLDNDPKLGLNLEDVEDIQDCLAETGRYTLRLPDGWPVVLYTDDVKRVYEEER